MIAELIQGLRLPAKVGFICAVLTAVYSISKPNYYRSEARIMPVESRASNGLGNLASAAAAFGVVIPAGEGVDANFVDILNSRWLREALLRSQYTFKAKSWRFGSDRQYKTTLIEFMHAENMDQAIGVSRQMFVASRDVKTRMLLVAAETVSPELSMQVVKRAVGLLEEFVQEKGRTRGGYKANFAEARLSEARAELADAEERASVFFSANKNYLGSFDPEVRLRGTRLEAELKLRQQVVLTLAVNREQALLEEKNDIPILTVLDLPNLPFEKSGPTRSVFVLMGFLVGGGICWCWQNRKLFLQ